jgi:hypothetical protein
MKKTLILSAFAAFFSVAHSQVKDSSFSRTNDLRFRWNMGQFANIGRYAVQFGLERDFAENKTISGELGLSQ